MRIASIGDELSAPGVLQNTVLVEALFGQKLAHEVTLRNLLKRRGCFQMSPV